MLFYVTIEIIFTLLQVKAAKLPLVIDADGLWHLISTPELIKGYTKAVLTPNAMEFSRLVKASTLLTACTSTSGRLVEKSLSTWKNNNRLCPMKALCSSY